MSIIVADSLMVLILLLLPVFIILIGGWLLGLYLENTPKENKKSDSDNDKVDR